MDSIAFSGELAHSSDIDKFYFQVTLREQDLKTLYILYVVDFFQFGDNDETVYFAASSKEDRKTWICKLEEGEIA